MCGYTALLFFFIVIVVGLFICSILVSIDRCTCYMLHVTELLMMMMMMMMMMINISIASTVAAEPESSSRLLNLLVWFRLYTGNDPAFFLLKVKMSVVLYLSKIFHQSCVNKHQHMLITFFPSCSINLSSNDRIRVHRTK